MWDQVDKYLERGADINIENYDGKTVRDIALSHYKFHLIKKFYKGGKVGKCKTNYYSINT